MNMSATLPQLLARQARDGSARAVMADLYEQQGDLEAAQCIREQSTPLRARLVTQILAELTTSPSITASAIAIRHVCGETTARTVLESMYERGVVTKIDRGSGSWPVRYGRHRRPIRTNGGRQ